MSSPARILLPLLSLSLAAAPSVASPQAAGGAQSKLLQGIDPLEDEDFPVYTADQVELGRLLFYDKELSGNRNTSCATCHHSLTDTGDGLALPLGEGASGLGMARATNGMIHERVPRNAPPVFNLGANEVTELFHDGRVAVDPMQPSGFLSPAGADLPVGLDSALAVQAMFPVTSGTEMAGQPGENTVADASGAGTLAGAGGVWDQLAMRLQAIPEYVTLFQAAYPTQVNGSSDITFVMAANAIAAFETVAWRASDTPFDRALRGERGVLTRAQRRGMKLFYGKAGCASCHSGTLLSDQEYHAIAMPQIGPGKGDGTYGYEDFGRERVTGDPMDRFQFRTPQLRNVALTGPWGHDGAYDTLEAVVRHHLDPSSSMVNYDRGQAMLPPDPALDTLDFACFDDPMATMALLGANELQPRALTDSEVGHLMEFLNALTDPSSLDLRVDIPFRVPSGLPLAD